MASSAIIPEPNADGFYSKALNARYEQFFIDNIQEGAVGFSLVDSANTGELLFLIWTQAAGFTSLPSRPLYLSTLDQCNRYIRQHPDLVPLLDVVHKKKAYAWFCESFAATTTPPNHPASLPKVKDTPIFDEGLIKERIAQFQPDLQAAISIYLKNDVQLPHWQPQWGSDAMKSHISGLKIPVISASSQSPSLLLHNLGQPSHDARLAERVGSLFGPGFDQRFLCNTSGSGKTRLLLEGLWRNWGLYFTARTQPEGVGSSDLENALQLLEQRGRLTTLTKENGSTALAANREVTSRHFLLVLYVRMFIFRVFLECAFMMGGITEKHKSRWLLIQVAPQTLLARPDVFTELNRSLRSASFEYLDNSVDEELSKVRKLLGPQPPTLFCVLDEAQVPTNMFSDCFLSDTEPVKPRPILRQIIFEWTSVIPNLIVSGTGVSMQELETVLGSVVAKEGGPQPKTVTNLGAFDNEKAQRAYLEQYLPPGFLDTDSGKAMTARVGYWLHGRHRFTATYLSRLIRTSFELPQQVLDDFVHDMTDFRPSDWDILSVDEPPTHPRAKLEKPRGFDFLNLKRDPALLRQIAGFVFDYIFNGKPRDVGGPNCEKLVEYGFARFGNLKDIIADEPLALLAAVRYFTTETAWSLRYFLVDGLSTSNDSARGIAFEQFGAYLLGLAFKSPTRLSTIFDFVGDNDLHDEVAELVAIEKTDGGFVCSPVDISSNMGPTYILGRTPLTETETLSWLKNPKRTIFCFPANTIGPDLILVLRLSDNSLLRVLVQFKHTTERTMSPSDTVDAFRTTDPKQFLSRLIRPATSVQVAPLPKKKNNKLTKPKARYIRNSELSQDLQIALRDLGPGTDKAGELGVLRVLVSYPATPNSDTLIDIVNNDNSCHPAATVDVTSLVTHPSEQQILKSLEVRVATAANQRKRKQPDDTEGPSSKRARRGV